MNPACILQRVAPFVIGLLVGLLPAYLSTGASEALRDHSHSASGSAYGTGNNSGSDPVGHGGDKVLPASRAFRITAKPQAKYTDVAREKSVQGKVRLRVTLLPSGNVGAITVEDRLPDGLTEQAIAAARKIRFEPAIVDGVPVEKTITIEYTFTIY